MFLTVSSVLSMGLFSTHSLAHVQSHLHVHHEYLWLLTSPLIMLLMLWIKSLIMDKLWIQKAGKQK